MNKSSVYKLLLAASIVLTTFSFAQSNQNGDNAGLHNSTNQLSAYDNIDLSSLYLGFSVPIATLDGVPALPMSYALFAEPNLSPGWSPMTNYPISGATQSYLESYNVVTPIAWASGVSFSWGELTGAPNYLNQTCPNSGASNNVALANIPVNWVFRDQSGTSHPFANAPSIFCLGDSFVTTATDNSGYELAANVWFDYAYSPNAQLVCVVTDGKGDTFGFSPIGCFPSEPNSVTDGYWNPFNTLQVGSGTAVNSNSVVQNEAPPAFNTSTLIFQGGTTVTGLASANNNYLRNTAVISEQGPYFGNFNAYQYNMWSTALVSPSANNGVMTESYIGADGTAKTTTISFIPFAEVVLNYPTKTYTQSGYVPVTVNDCVIPQGIMSENLGRGFAGAFPVGTSVWALPGQGTVVGDPAAAGNVPPTLPNTFSDILPIKITQADGSIFNISYEATQTPASISGTMPVTVSSGTVTITLPSALPTWGLIQGSTPCGTVICYTVPFQISGLTNPQLTALNGKWVTTATYLNSPTYSVTFSMQIPNSGGTGVVPYLGNASASDTVMLTIPSPVTGRISSISLPTGGTISYTYSGGTNGTGVWCQDGSYAKVTRVSDVTTTFSHTPQTGKRFSPRYVTVNNSTSSRLTVDAFIPELGYMTTPPFATGDTVTFAGFGAAQPQTAMLGQTYLNDFSILNGMSLNVSSIAMMCPPAGARCNQSGALAPVAWTYHVTMNVPPLSPSTVISVQSCPAPQQSYNCVVVTAPNSFHQTDKIAMSGSNCSYLNTQGGMPQGAAPTSSQFTIFIAHNNCTSGPDANLAALPVRGQTFNNGISWAYIPVSQGVMYSGDQSSTTIVTDAIGNQTVYTFVGTLTTQRKVWQGSATTGTLLLSEVYCYNGAVLPCADPAIPIVAAISEKDIYSYIPGISVPALHSYFYNSLGKIYDERAYDFGVGTFQQGTQYPYQPLPAVEVATTYGSYDYGNVGCDALSSPITFFTESSGQIYLASLTYSDNNLTCRIEISGSTSTAVTPQLYSAKRFTYSSLVQPIEQDESIFPAGAATDATLLSFPVVSTFFSIDPISQEMTAQIQPSGLEIMFSNTLCNNTLPGTVTLNRAHGGSQISTHSSTYDCNTGVKLNQTDENGNLWKSFYSDPFGRVSAIRDPMYSQTYTSQLNYTYTNNSTDKKMVFNNGSSTNDVITTIDAWGRKVLAQTLSNSSSTPYSTIQTGYDVNQGFITSSTVPFAAAAGQSSSGSPPATRVTYDATGRVKTINSPAGGVTTYTYSANDVLITASPAPIGENVKERQLETDGLGRVVSICDVSTTLMGSSTCGQTVSQAGFLTLINYDPAGHVTEVIQNAGSGVVSNVTVNADKSLTITCNCSFLQPGASGQRVTFHNMSAATFLNGATVTTTSAVFATNFTATWMLSQPLTAASYPEMTGEAYGAAINSSGQVLSESRTNTYDSADRILTETSPESGTVAYVYDQDPTGACAGWFPGSLIRATDNSGQISCFQYDGLGRITQVYYPNAPVQAQRQFVYDSSPNTAFVCPTGKNTKGMLAEATTANAAQNAWTGTPNTGSIQAAPIANITGSQVSDFGGGKEFRLYGANSFSPSASNLVTFVGLTKASALNTKTYFIDNVYDPPTSTHFSVFGPGPVSTWSETADTGFVTGPVGETNGQNIPIGGIAVSSVQTSLGSLSLTTGPMAYYPGACINQGVYSLCAVSTTSAPILSGMVFQGGGTVSIGSSFVGTFSGEVSWTAVSGNMVLSGPVVSSTGQQGWLSVTTPYSGVWSGQSSVSVAAGSFGSLQTDWGACYSPRYDVTDVYEQTPHSGGYIHTSVSYYENGLPETLSGLPNLPTFSYGLNAQGDLTSVAASSGTNPVTNVVYNIAEETTEIDLGGGDTSVFTYDAYFRPKTFQHNVGLTNVSGTYTFSPNGSLKQLTFLDKSNNPQICSYAYDDLFRLTQAHCGQSIWFQDFSYDVFGNITKTVPQGDTGQAFNPGYQVGTNFYQTNGQYAYDAKGNLTQDGTNAYIWNAASKLVATNAMGLTLDSFNRPVESLGPQLLYQSTQIQTSPWLSNSTTGLDPTVTGNATSAPDGTTTATKIVFQSASGNGSNWSGWEQGSVAVPTASLGAAALAGHIYTFSVFLKADAATSISLILESNGHGFNNTQVANVTTSWQRYSVSYTMPANMDGDTQINVHLRNYGVSVITLYAWGAQVEGNSSASPLQVSPFIQYAYAPTGELYGKLSNGSTLLQGFVSIPAGTAVYASNGTLDHFRRNDFAANGRVSSTPAKSLVGQSMFAPFGETFNLVGSPDGSFAGMSQDVLGVGPVSTTFARPYNSTHGRWLSPDPILGNPGVPLSLNRYVYAKNQPLERNDPLGTQDDGCSSSNVDVCAYLYTDAYDYSDYFDYFYAYNCAGCDAPAVVGGGSDLTILPSTVAATTYSTAWYGYPTIMIDDDEPAPAFRQPNNLGESIASQRLETASNLSMAIITGYTIGLTGGLGAEGGIEVTRINPVGPLQPATADIQSWLSFRGSNPESIMDATPDSSFITKTMGSVDKAMQSRGSGTVDAGARTILYRATRFGRDFQVGSSILTGPGARSFAQLYSTEGSIDAYSVPTWELESRYGAIGTTGRYSYTNLSGLANSPGAWEIKVQSLEELNWIKQYKVP